jgi:hypothetical protein
VFTTPYIQLDPGSIDELRVIVLKSESSCSKGWVDLESLMAVLESDSGCPRSGSLCGGGVAPRSACISTGEVEREKRISM